MPRWSRFDPAADRRLVKGLHDDDEDALAALYDIYAERLYDYCLSLTGEAKTSADIVHDTFIDATRRAPRLRDRSWLRTWLYAAARRRCFRRGSPTALYFDCAVLEGLDLPYQEALFLAERHDLTGDELAAVLGVSTRRAQSRVSKARRLAPEGEPPPEPTPEPTPKPPPDPTADQTPAPTADDTEFLDVNAPPAPEPPAGLRRRILHTGSDPELAGYRAEIAARGGGLTPDGLPRQIDVRSPQAKKWMFAGTGFAAAIAAAAAALVVIGPGLPGVEWRWPADGRHPGSPSPSGPGGPGGKDGRSKAPGVPPQAAPEMTPRWPNYPGAPFTRNLPPTKPGQPSTQPPGQIMVTPASLHFTGGETTMTLALFTEGGGALSWTAAGVNPPLSLSPTSGDIPKDGQVSVQVVLNRGLVTLPGKTTISFNDSERHSVQVSVTWDLSLL